MNDIAKDIQRGDRPWTELKDIFGKDVNPEIFTNVKSALGLVPTDIHLEIHYDGFSKEWRVIMRDSHMSAAGQGISECFCCSIIAAALRLCNE